jgi:RNA polymerase sigma factor (sigma-70 family)
MSSLLQLVGPKHFAVNSYCDLITVERRTTAVREPELSPAWRWDAFVRKDAMLNSDQTPAVNTERLFVTTQWSVVATSQTAGGPEAEKALAILCQSYWYPLYSFVRRQGNDAHDAQDLVQGFFAKLIEKNYLKEARREKGRLRSFLLLALKRYMANEWDRVNRQKRGGGQEIVSLNLDETESRFLAQAQNHASPERDFDRRWAIALLDQVLAQLQEEHTAKATGKIFEELKIFLTGEKSERTYGEIAQQLGVAEGTLRNTAFRLRERYREILLGKIRETVDTPEEVEAELRDLLAALS